MKRFEVSRVTELEAALSHIKSGDTISIQGDAVLDLTNLHPVQVPGGVIIVGNRGRNGSQGALLFTTSLDALPLISVTGDSTRLTGLRIFGPDSSRRTIQMKVLQTLGKYYSIPNSRGIQSSADFLEVDNCEIMGWSHAGIFLNSGARDANIHHNIIHHNQRSGLGYGIALKSSQASIHENYFNWNRHAIAGTGQSGTSYHAYKNIVGSISSGHAFDMHGYWMDESSEAIGGDSIRIEDNIFHLSDYPAVMIRGTPRLGAEITNNTFNTSELDKAVVLKNEAVNVKIFKNTLLK